MENETRHIDNDLNKTSIFNVDPPQYSRTKEEIWDNVFEELQYTEGGKNRKMPRLKTRLFYGVAASLVLLLGTVLMMRFYSDSVYCPDGDQISHILPDGSEVVLQPNSTLTYYPLWWNFSRRLVLSGEAYFNVTKGNKFIVSSPMGSTYVLGTSFNIVSRNFKYVVTCFTGRVQVIAFTKRSVVLDPDYTAEVVDGDIKVSKFSGPSSPKQIDSSMFDYQSVPLEMVINDMEEHFAIVVTTSTTLGYNYSGRFSKNKSADDVLYILCKPYDLKFVKLSENKYHILKD